MMHEHIRHCPDVKSTFLWAQESFLWYWRKVGPATYRETLLRKLKHTLDVVHFAQRLDMSEYGLFDSDLTKLVCAAIIHDIGRLPEAYKYQSLQVKNFRYDHAGLGAEWFHITGPEIDGKQQITHAVSQHSLIHIADNDALSKALQDADKLALIKASDEKFKPLIVTPTPISLDVLTAYNAGQMIEKKHIQTPSDHIVCVAAWFGHFHSSSAKEISRDTNMPALILSLLDESLGKPGLKTLTQL